MRSFEALNLFMVSLGLLVAIGTLRSIERQVEIAGQQIEIAKQQIEDARDALRLEQRPWLRYERPVIEVRANDTSGWEERDPEAGERFRGSLQVRNAGKTPALNVRLMSVPPTLIPADDDELPAEPEEEEWLGAVGTPAIFPDDDRLRQNTESLRMLDRGFSEYSSHSMKIVFWTKLYYCDTTGHRHWTQIGVARLSEAGRSRIEASSVSPDPGEPNHPDCQN